jgi:hypothetical protein
MLIRNFNQPVREPNLKPDLASGSAAPPGSELSHQSESIEHAASDLESRSGTEIKLLQVRIEHLELVVETARSLMTSNQERLLRRLHDVPHELMRLTAKMTQYSPTNCGETNTSEDGTRLRTSMRNAP